MTVKRIVKNIAATNPSDAHVFYRDLLGLSVVMDHGVRLSAPLVRARISVK